MRALRVPYSILMPLIIVFCITGAYSLKNSVFLFLRPISGVLMVAALAAVAVPVVRAAVAASRRRALSSAH